MNFLSFPIRENEIVLGSRIIISLICYTISDSVRLQDNGVEIGIFKKDCFVDVSLIKLQYIIYFQKYD